MVVRRDRMISLGSEPRVFLSMNQETTRGDSQTKSQSERITVSIRYSLCDPTVVRRDE